MEEEEETCVLIQVWGSLELHHRQRWFPVRRRWFSGWASQGEGVCLKFNWEHGKWVLCLESIILNLIESKGPFIPSMCFLHFPHCIHLPTCLGQCRQANLGLPNGPTTICSSCTTRALHPLVFFIISFFSHYLFFLIIFSFFS